MKKKVLVLTGGGDCPGLNAVIRGIVKRAAQTEDWEVVGSIQSFDGVLREPTEIIELSEKRVSGIHYQGGTILGTTTKGGPLAWPVKENDGTWSFIDRSDEMIRKLKHMGVEAVISIGGDGSQRISQVLFEKGLNIIGVPKTIDNDLSATDYTFGYQTAVQIATEAVDRLVTTAASHNRVIILEVMGRDAGWIALSSAIAGGAEICLIPEIPYDINNVLKVINKRFKNGKGHVIIVVAEGAKPMDGDVLSQKNEEIGNANLKLGGIANKILKDLKTAGCNADMRETVLGHLQRGGVPIAFDRILATQFGVKAMELALESNFGKMVAYQHPSIVAVPFLEAISKYNVVKPDSSLVKTARGIGMSFGDN
ncbi:MAG: ATP-dependent 6-phosphofructokinase [Lutibacter sp.]|uniref:6-phosphofructokinase n=1 Tax=Lutibacter sp. TaxID=1925666 RepID=UPI001A061281|nr:ATP-dependent 6-phosphofructokinase [Lutibacter sp.]NOR28165.1 ATP-dependent 6-phosphofructokinase [Lutibacter sp.]